MQQDQGSWFVNGSYIYRFNRKGLVNIGQNRRLRRDFDVMDDILRQYRSCGFPYDEGKIETAQDLQGISPGFERSTLFRQDGEPASTFIEWSTGLRQTLKADLAGLPLKSRD
jgi:hypothetical protein